MSIAENIKKLRLSHNMSQQEFGEIAGVSDKAVSTWENGIKTPRMGAVEKMSQYFNIPKSRILDELESVPLQSSDKEENTLLYYFRNLNRIGKDKALDYLKDLTENNKYTENK